jgi:hypothetical protein
MTPAQAIAAALRELLAATPDRAQARTYISEIPTTGVDAVAGALVELAYMAAERQASLRVKAGAR